MRSAESAITTFGGVLVGVSLSQALGNDVHAWLRVTALLTTMLGAYLILGPPLRWPYPGRTVDARHDLAREARDLMAEISTFAASRRETDAWSLGQQLQPFLAGEGERILRGWAEERIQ